MEEELLFLCEMCGEMFEPDPDSMVTIDYSSYAILNAPESHPNVDTEWEGHPEFNLNPEKLPIAHIKVESPEELSNTAMCICKICRNKLLD